MKGERGGSGRAHIRLQPLATARMVVKTSTGGRAPENPMKTIDDHILEDLTELEAAKAAGDAAKLGHLTDELKSLEEYKAHHPEDNHDPSPLEVYCDLNPEAPECRVYDD